MANGASSLRIVKWPYKLVYAVVGYAVVFAISAALRPILPSIASSIVNAALFLALFLVAARIFRGAEEDIEAPRARWRMTSRPTLSRNLGILFVVVGAFEILGLLSALIAPFMPPGYLSGTQPDPSAFIVALIQTAILAALYLVSARRLSGPRTKQTGRMISQVDQRDPRS